MQPGVFEKQCSKFADRMRHASSFELVQRIKRFINEFVGVQSSDSAEQSSQMVRSFVEVHV
jgi:Mn-dependent DtxR family transcriptional regulator